LAEQGNGLNAWKTIAVQLTGDVAEARLASDLFLDGLLFAANSEPLLEQVWLDLVANEGQVLHRLLNRLLHVASFPDWRLRGLVDRKLVEQSEVWLRIPYPLYWYPVLRVLSRHARELAEHALRQTAEVCALWLRTMPVEMPGRREAGLLALELAKEMQGLIAEGMHFGDKDKVIYEAVLSAAPEFPEEVTQIALELCARRDEPKHAIQSAAAAEERHAEMDEEWTKNHPDESTARPYMPDFIPHSQDPTPPPAADGPLRELSDGFRAAVLETIALNRLVLVRPEVAREVLLAVCIDAPKPSNPYDNDPFLRQRLGMADWRGGYPAMYWKGPFLKFLEAAPKQGLDSIIRLVNYATRQWIENGLGKSPTEEEYKKHGLEFVINGKNVCWIGDVNVFGWHRYLPMHGDTIECALMALEKWFYEEIENGRGITEWVQYVFDHGESLAFAGVFISVGLRYPVFFTRELQPLLGNFYVYHWQRSWALNEQGETWRIGLSRLGEPAVELAVAWHSLPHRRFILWDTVPVLMLRHEGTVNYLSERKVEWAKQVWGNDKANRDLEFFLARFNPENYTETPQPDGSVLIALRWPSHLEAIARDSQEESALKMLSISLALRARRLLNEQETLPPKDVQEFATQIQKLANWKPPIEDESKDHYRIDSIAGGLAVLILGHRMWLSQHPELEKWSLNTLRGLEPSDPEHYSPVSLSNHSAELFKGEIGVALLLESSEEWVLQIAFQGITGSYYTSTLHTMWRAYLLRERLGEKFGEMVNVVILWSALRRAANCESGYYADRALLAKYKKTLFHRFAAGKLKGPLIPLRRAETLGRRLTERISRRSMSSGERRAREAQQQWIREHGDDSKLHREMPEIDMQVIQNGFGFLAAMVRDASHHDKQNLHQYIGELFDLEMRTLPHPKTGQNNCEISGTANEFDMWVMARIAEFIAHAPSIETARVFYRPILELGPPARYWVEDFLQAWVSNGLQMTTDLESFSKVWQDMVQYTTTLPPWQPGKSGYWCPAESLAVDLMGLREIVVAVLGNVKYKGVVSAMAPTIRSMGEQMAKIRVGCGLVCSFSTHRIRSDFVVAGNQATGCRDKFSAGPGLASS
jgi:hypothetical protein